MKIFFQTLLLFICVGVSQAHAQCGNYSGDPNTLPVCGQYGDANGNSNWNWELTDKNDPSYCSMWYARTDASGNLTPMGSPFVDAGTSVLDVISQQRDFTHDKGWELLRRDFGCSRVTAYPYFILYNRYSGLMRIYVYIPAGQIQYSGIAVEISPNPNSAYPATTAFSDTIQTTPDKYLTSTPAGGFGKGMVSIGDLAGNSRWSLVEFTPSFDPNIQNTIYTGALLQFKIYGVTNNAMFASIKGGSVVSNQPLYNFTYKPTQAITATPQGFDFKGVGEKFTRVSTGINSIRTDIFNTASSIVNFLSTDHDDSLKSKVLCFFKEIKDFSNETGDFVQTFGKIGEAAKGIGSFFKVIGAVMGLFNAASGTPAANPSYTNYDLVLQGTINTKLIVSSFVLRVPGTVQNNNDNAPYYRCPVGIFNLKNTPEADVITYDRTDRYRWDPDPNSPLRDIPMTRDYVSYRIRNNIAVAFNDGAGLELVSAQAAIVGEVLPDAQGNASYDLFEKHNAFSGTYYRVINHMRAELETGHLEVKHFDPQKKLHIFQTPYANIECLNGLAFNAPATTKIYLQVKAVLKKKNDPSNTPIVFIQNYNLQTFPQTITNESDYYFFPKETLPPYANYTELPLYRSDLVTTAAPAGFTQADGAITTSGGMTVWASSAPVYFTAGTTITLKPGFRAETGSYFRAFINNYGYSLNCTTPQVEAYTYPGNCFNTSITALRKRTDQDITDSVRNSENEAGKFKIYPVPAGNNIFISGIKLLDRPTISILDQSGRTIRNIAKYSTGISGNISLDVSDLSNGVYFISIQTSGMTTTKKIVISR